jgi:hypothetical protein
MQQGNIRCDTASDKGKQEATQQFGQAAFAKRGLIGLVRHKLLLNDRIASARPERRWKRVTACMV